MASNFMITGKPFLQFIYIRVKDRQFIKDSLKKIDNTLSALNFSRISFLTWHCWFLAIKTAIRFFLLSPLFLCFIAFLCKVKCFHLNTQGPIKAQETIFRRLQEYHLLHLCWLVLAEAKKQVMPSKYYF